MADNKIRQFKMRQLKTADIFKMSKILKKLNINLKIDFSQFKNKDLSQQEIGIKIVSDLIKEAIENLHLAEDEINSFLAELVGIAVEEFKELPIKDTIQIISLFKNQEGLSTFLEYAGK